MADYYLNSGNGSIFQINHAYNLGDRVFATSAATAARKQRVYEVTTAGTTAGSEPAWNTTVGGTTTSNTCVFTARNPTTWANANGVLNYLCGAVLVAGDRIFVKNTHSESLAAVGSQNTIGTAANPVRLICVSDNNEPPTTLATGALIASTGVMAIGTGTLYAYGVEFRSGDGGATTANIEIGSSIPQAGHLFAEQCEFNLAATAGTSVLRPVGSASGESGLWMRNCNVRFGASGASIANIGSLSRMFWRGGSVLGTAPTILFLGSSINAWALRVEGVDLSLVTGTIFALNANTDALYSVTLIGCKLNASATLFGSSFRHTGLEEPWSAIDCADDSKNYRIAVRGAIGDLTEEASIVRGGGATDGTTPISWKIVTTATAAVPPTIVFYTPWMLLWNESLVSKTLTMEIVHDSATNLKDNEVWLEVEYLGSSATPLLTVAHTAPSIIAAGSDLASSSVTWSGTGGFTNPNKQKVSVTFTPQMKGVIRVRLAVAKASKTLYVDPYLQDLGPTSLSRQVQVSADQVQDSGMSFAAAPLAISVGDGMVPQPR